MRLSCGELSFACLAPSFLTRESSFKRLFAVHRARLDCSDSTTEDISLSDEEGSVLFSPIKLACDWPTGSHKMRTEKALDVPLSLTLGFGSTDVFLYFLEFRPIVVHKEENGRIDIPATQYKSSCLPCG